MYSVILIDDEFFVLKSLEKRLDWETLGFRIVHTATSGSEGLEMCLKAGPDVVFVDIRMPGLGGLEVIRKLGVLELPPLTVVISGYAEFAYAKEALNLGAIGFCTKPFDDEELRQVLEKAKGILDERNTDEEKHGEDFQGAAGEICAYLREHYADSCISVQHIANRFGFNANYLSQMFKSVVGEKLTAYLAGIRIRHACDLLTESALSVAEVSARVGFSDYCYFARVFKKQTGYTPLEYRQEKR